MLLKGGYEIARHAEIPWEDRKIVDGLTLGPLDVILGPSNEPHGPLHYPQGCQLFSAFLGSFFHSEVEHLATEKHYRLIRSADIPWTSNGGIDRKTLVDRGCGTVLLEALRAPAGATFAEPRILAAIVVEGSAEIEDETLGPWDFFYASPREKHASVTFPEGATLLTVTLR